MEVKALILRRDERIDKMERDVFPCNEEPTNRACATNLTPVHIADERSNFESLHCGEIDIRARFEVMPPHPATVGRESDDKIERCQKSDFQKEDQSPLPERTPFRNRALVGSQGTIDKDTICVLHSRKRWICRFLLHFKNRAAHHRRKIASARDV